MDPFFQDDPARWDQLRTLDADTVEKFVKTFESRIMNFLKSFDLTHQEREDICQETFMNVLRAFSKKEEIIECPYGYLQRAAGNQAMRVLTAKYRREKLEKSLNASTSDDASSIDVSDPKGVLPSARASNDETAKIVQKAMLQLAPAHRQVLELRYQQDLRLEEIADFLGLTLAEVRTLIQNAATNLRRILKLNGRADELL